MPNCNCCSEPPCPFPGFECDSIVATKPYCGLFHDGAYYMTVVQCSGGAKVTSNYNAAADCALTTTSVPEISCCGTLYEHEGAYYKKRITTVDYDFTEIVFGEPGTTFTKHTVDWDVINTDCSETHVYVSGSASSITAAYSCTATRDGSGNWTKTVTNGGLPPETTPGECTYPGFPGEDVITYADVVTPVPFATTYSNPDTAEALVARTVAALPAYPSTWSGDCSAVKDINYGCSIRRFKWRLFHEPSGTCYLKVWLQRRFVPEGGGAPTITTLSPYTWTDSGSPCFTDGSKPPGHLDNRIVGATTEQMEPSTDGEITIEIVKYSCVEGYVPPDDGSANGFPVPA